VKLLIITGEYPPIKSGDAAHAYHLAQRLAKEGLEVRVLTSAIDGAVQHPSFKVSAVMRKWTWRSLPQLRRFMKSFAPDAILQLFMGRMYGDHPMMTFAPSIARSVLPRVRYVIQFETPVIDKSNYSLVTRIIRKVMVHRVSQSGVGYSYGTLLRDSDHIISLCGPYRDLLAEEYPQIEEKCSLIPPPPLMTIAENEKETAKETGRKRLGLPKEAFVFAYFGYIYPEKGIEFLLPAFKSIVSRHPHARLVLIGGHGDDPFDLEKTNQNRRYFQRMQQLAKSLDLGDRIIWTGACNTETEEGSLYLFASDACVLPMNYGIKLNNSSLGASVCHGLPTIATRDKMIDDELLDRNRLLLCSPCSEISLANAMESLISQPQLYSRLQIGAQELAQEWFSWEKAIERTLAALGIHKLSTTQKVQKKSAISASNSAVF
jgi:glycosyltransferase involved in cell wall biosynthesis